MVNIVKLIDPIQLINIPSGLVPKGAYSAGTDYAVGDSVDYNGSSYVMFNDAGAGTVPTNTTYWQVLADKGDTGATGSTGAAGADGAAGVGVPTAGTTGQVLAKASNADYDTEWSSAGAGDMAASVYDPNTVAADAFDQDNMVDGTTNKNYTATEKTKLAGIATAATANSKATGAELDTGTDDAKFATAKAIKDSHNVPSVAPSTSGNYMKSDGTDWTSAAIPTWNQNTSGTAANLSGTPALPNGTTATTQSGGDNSTKLATTAYADAAGGGSPAWGDITGTLSGQTDLQSALDAKQNSLGFTAEDVANKSTTTTLGTSDTLYPSQKAVKTYVDTVAQGLSVKQSVRLATAAALPANTYLAGVITITATGTLTVDGTVTALSDRILVKDESSQLENGVYVCTTAGAVGVAAVLTRSSDMDAGTEFPGAFVFSEIGTANAAAGFVCTNSTAPTVGTTAITFTQFSGAGEITAGDALTKTGNTLDVAVDSSTIEVSSDALRVKDGGITLAKQANMASASVVYRKTAGSGAPEVNTLATLKTDLGLTGTNSGDQTTVSGNAGTATVLATARAINGVDFDGSAAITIPNIFLTLTSADSVGTGLIVGMTYGESITLGAPLYFKSDGKVYNADANGSSTYPVMGLALATASSGTNNVLLQGIYQFASAHSDFTVGGTVYLSTTVGTFTQTQPSATDDVIQVCGIALAADTLYFNPQLSYITHT